MKEGMAWFSYSLERHKSQNTFYWPTAHLLLLIYLQRPCGQLRYVNNIHTFSKSLIDHPYMSKNDWISRDTPLKKLIKWKGTLLKFIESLQHICTQPSKTKKMQHNTKYGDQNLDKHFVQINIFVTFLCKKLSLLI